MSRRSFLVIVLVTIVASIALGATNDEIKAYHRFGSGDLLVKYAHVFSVGSQGAVLRLGNNISTKLWWVNVAVGVAFKGPENPWGTLSFSPLITATFEDTSLGKPYLGASCIEFTLNLRKKNSYELELKGIPGLTWKDRTSPLNERLSLSHYCFATYTLVGSDIGGMVVGLQEDLKLNKDGCSIYLGPRVERIITDRIKVYTALGVPVHSTFVKPASLLTGWCELKIKF